MKTQWLLAMLAGAGFSFGQVDLGIEFVTVGDPGNPPDPLTGNQYGSVSYAFRISKHEITNGHWVTFLNAVDPMGANSLGLYSSYMATRDEGGILFEISRPYGHKYYLKTNLPDWGKRPVNFVAFLSCARFVNWITTGDSETGTYPVTNGNAGSRSSLTAFWIPSYDEWYKAAYYQGPNSPLLPVYGTDYALYPMGGFVANNNPIPGDQNSANAGNRYQLPLPVGSYPFAVTRYGALDMGGNLAELVDSTPRNAAGGNLASAFSALRSDAGLLGAGVFGGTGFRIAASMPQPPPVVPTLAIKQAAELEWQSQIGVRYQIQWSPNMGSWFNLATKFPATDCA